MNKNKIIAISIILNLLLIVICINSNTNTVLSGEKQIIKEMTEGEYESQITELNKSHEDYANIVNEYKIKIAQAITNQKVETSETATADEVVTNIGEILKARTSDADATAADIAKGKKAYVDGELITGRLEELKNINDFAISWFRKGTAELYMVYNSDNTYLMSNSNGTFTGQKLRVNGGISGSIVAVVEGNYAIVQPDGSMTEKKCNAGDIIISFSEDYHWAIVIALS